MSTYQIQQIAMDECGADMFSAMGMTMSVVAEVNSEDEALRLWSSYCSGACDSDAPFDGQNHGRAYFYRIVERSAYVDE